MIEQPAKKPVVVGLKQPGNQTKLDALLMQLGSNVVSAQVGGWTAFSDNQGALDAVQNATAKLADNNAYRAAIAKLSSDALVRAYANGTEAQQLLDALGPQAQTSGTNNVPFAWASVDVAASGDGVRVSGYAHDASLPTRRLLHQRVRAQLYASSLVDEIPSGAILVADFPVAPGQFEFSPGSTSRLEKLFGTNAATLASELDAVLGGETAVYVRPGVPIPEITLVTQPNDTVSATRALADVLTAPKALPGAKAGGLRLGNIPIVHAVAGGQLVVSTSKQGIADFRSGGAKASSDPGFKTAQQTSNTPAGRAAFTSVKRPSA